VCVTLDPVPFRMKRSARWPDDHSSSVRHSSALWMSTKCAPRSSVRTCRPGSLDTAATAFRIVSRLAKQLSRPPNDCRKAPM